MTETGVVLLAAGQSLRFGHDKRLISVSAGHEPMLLTTIRQIQRSGLPLFVVLHPGDQQWAQELQQQGIDWGICPESAHGIGQSLAFGVHATQHWQNWLVAMADMPFIQPQTFVRIARALKQHAIVRPVVTRTLRRSLPQHQLLGFGRILACELMQAEGDDAIRHLLQQHAAQVFDMRCHDRGILRDIDQPDDL